VVFNNRKNRSPSDGKTFAGGVTVLSKTPLFVRLSIKLSSPAPTA